MNKRVLISTIFIMLIAATAFILVQRKVNHPDLAPKKSIDISGQPTLNKGANIQIVAFEDLKCSNCKRYNTELYPDIKKQYIDTGKASYTNVTLAFLPGSEPAGNAALCLAEQSDAYYFEFTDYVFQNQPDEMLNWATPETLLEFASHVNGYNKTALESCMESNRYKNRIELNLKLAEKIMPEQVGTPAIFINGYKLTQLDMDGVNQLIKASS